MVNNAVALKREIVQAASLLFPCKWTSHLNVRLSKQYYFCSRVTFQHRSPPPGYQEIDSCSGPASTASSSSVSGPSSRVYEDLVSGLFVFIGAPSLSLSLSLSLSPSLSLSLSLSLFLTLLILCMKIGNTWLRLQSCKGAALPVQSFQYIRRFTIYLCLVTLM